MKHDFHVERIVDGAMRFRVIEAESLVSAEMIAFGSVTNEQRLEKDVNKSRIQCAIRSLRS